MLRLLILFPLVFFSLACTRKEPLPVEHDFTYKIDNEAFTDALFPYFLGLEKKYGLRPEFIFICYDLQVDKLKIVLSSQQILEVKQARRWVVDIVEGMLDEVNSYPSLLANHWGFPFDISNVDLYVNFESFYGVYVDPTFVGAINLNDGIVHYSAFGFKNWRLDKWGCRIERYSLAKRLIELEDAHEAPYKLAEGEIRGTKMQSAAKERYIPDNAPLLPPKMGRGY